MCASGRACCAALSQKHNISHQGRGSSWAQLGELFGLLTAALLEQEGKELAEEMSKYLRKHRRELAELSGAQTRAAYGLVEYGEREARMLLRIAEEAIEKLKELEGKIFA